MEFREDEINLTDLDECPKNIAKLIINYLCNKNDLKVITIEDENLLKRVLDSAKKFGLNFRQFNELLLLLNQDKVGEDFFKFFYKKEKITIDDLKNGIREFRGYALLSFGSFRFAYKELSQKNKEEILKKLSPYCKNSSQILKEFENRPQKMLDIEKIPKDNTWYLGEVSGSKINKEADYVNKLLNEGRNKELLEFKDIIVKMGREVEEIQKTALKNADIYLTWDYMDVYIATSMRNKWEFFDVYDFIGDVFDTNLKDLNVRYFDPTQSKCANPRDKGLIEGLMLKRALCTIYLAQESDTMGKDSELAATLAQSKPVIAYVPKYDPNEYAEKIRKYPPDFFKKRLLILEAEEIFDDDKCIEKINKKYPNFGELIDEFLDILTEHRNNQPFTLWDKKENEFKEKYENFGKICEILAIAECYNFDKRAILLQSRHPLSLQVDLQSGVANGVLVVRDPKSCTELLKRILLNQMKFQIRRNEGYTALYEEISNSIFRVVTDNERLTNSFWNLF